MPRATASIPDRIRGFTSLADHEAATYEGKLAAAAHGEHTLRRVWHDGEWWHSIVDIVTALTASKDGRKYWNKLKERLVAEGSQVVTECHQLKLPAQDGRMRATDCAPNSALFRIIQSIPSPNVEPIKVHLAQVGAEAARALGAVGPQPGFHPYIGCGFVVVLGLREN